MGRAHAQPGPWAAGVDGAAGGWLAVLWNGSALRARLLGRFADALTLEETPAVVAVDMIIGLMDWAERGGRAADREARALLGRPRGSSVFPAPARPALGASTFADALAANRASGPDGVGLSRAAFNLFAKIREVDAALTPELQERVIEAHPELSFYAMNGDAPVVESKHTPHGRERRRRLLRAHGMEGVDTLLREHVGAGVKADDVLDACAACWTAERARRGAAIRLPDPPPRDARGLRMEIWR